VEIRIGITNTGRELTFDAADSASAVREQIVQALGSGDAHVTLADVKGSTYIVPTAGIAYVEIGSEESRRVGFVA
jgi:Protein of unknown function (DUF3107)